jgi:hypothetical protein
MVNGLSWQSAASASIGHGVSNPWHQAARLNVRVDTAQPSMAAVANLADRHGLTAYDAAYLELAMRHKFGLITQDQDLVRAAEWKDSRCSAGRTGAAQKRRRYNV